MQKSLAKNSIYNIIYTGANIIFPFITSIYVSRILLPAGVGRVAACQNIASYFVTLAALGLPSYGVREFAKVHANKENSNKLFTELFSINLFSTLLAVISYILLIFGNDTFNCDWLLFISCGLSILFNFFNIDWLYQGREEYGYITARSIVIKMVSLAAIVLFVKTRQDITVYALISSLAIGGNHLFNVIHARLFIKLDFGNINIKRHIKPVMTIALIVFLSSIYNKIDITMLGVMATDESVGFYTYAQKTVNIVITLAIAVTAALLPRLSFDFDNNRQAFYRLLDKGFQVLCITVLPLCVGLFIVSDEVVQFLYGEAFLPAALTIRLMCPLILIKSFGNLFCYQLSYATGNEKVIVPASASASTINVIINAVLIPLFLQNGAVIASVLSELVTNFVQFVYMKKKIKYMLNMKVLLQEIFITVIMVICVRLLSQVSDSNTISLIVEVIGGAFVCVVGNFVVKNTILFEVIDKLLLKGRRKI